MACFQIITVYTETPQKSNAVCFNRSDNDLTPQLFAALMVQMHNVRLDDVDDYVADLVINWTEDRSMLVIKIDTLIWFLKMV